MLPSRMSLPALRQIPTSLRVLKQSFACQCSDKYIVSPGALRLLITQALCGCLRLHTCAKGLFFKVSPSRSCSLFATSFSWPTSHISHFTTPPNKFPRWLVVCCDLFSQLSLNLQHVYPPHLRWEPGARLAVSKPQPTPWLQALQH